MGYMEQQYQQKLEGSIMGNALSREREFLRIIIKMAFLLDNAVANGSMEQFEIDTLQNAMNTMSVELGYTDYIDALHKL